MTNHAEVLTALADRPAVSQHLKVLKAAGLVTDQAAGTRRVYSVDQAGLAAIRAWFEQFWQQSLARYAAVASQPAPPAEPAPAAQEDQ